MKRCYRCGETKPITEFYTCKSKRDGVTSECKPCKYLQVKASTERHRKAYRETKNRWNKKHLKTPEGWINTVFCSMRLNSKRRGHPMPDISRDDLRAMISTPEFRSLWSAYVASNFDRRQKPSLDRIDNASHYTLSNVRLVTWSENHRTWMDGLRQLTGGKA